MIAVTPILKGEAAQAFEELFDQYFRMHQIGKPGEWHGEGRERLGLGSMVYYNDFFNVLNELTPDGKSPLLTGKPGPAHPCAWHVRFTAPGSVSVLWALAPPDVRHTIFKSHSKAVAAFAWQLPHPWDDLHQDDPNLLFACFCYGASKALTPELGAHAILINAGFRANGERTAITGQDPLQHILDPDIYYSSLAQDLAGEVGDLRPENYGRSDYRIPAVPPEFYRQEGTASHQDSGKQGSIFSPNCPRHSITPELLFSSWGRAAQSFGWGPREVEGIVRSIRRERAYEEFRRNNLPPRLSGERRERVKAATDYLVAGQFLEQRARRAAVGRATAKAIKPHL